jgi:hypothetical protein
LATTDVMLASTVQFSRYGRSRPPLPSRVRRPVLAEGASRPFPQDPTACSAREPLASGVPSPDTRGRQGCTSRHELVHGPNNQCSTSELPPQDTRLRCGSGRVRRTAGAPGAP